MLPFLTASSSKYQCRLLYIHLEDARSGLGVAYGGTEIFVDFAWYAEYKPTVDAFLSGFLWLAWLWLVFKRLADIINGVGMASDYAGDLENGFRVSNRSLMRDKDG